VLYEGLDQTEENSAERGVDIKDGVGQALLTESEKWKMVKKRNAPAKSRSVEARRMSMLRDSTVRNEGRSAQNVKG
jgi:hypothetical protein